MHPSRIHGASGKSKGSDAWKRSETSRHPSKIGVKRYVGSVSRFLWSFLVCVFFFNVCLLLHKKTWDMWRYVPTTLKVIRFICWANQLLTIDLHFPRTAIWCREIVAHMSLTCFAETFGCPFHPISHSKQLTHFCKCHDLKQDPLTADYIQQKPTTPETLAKMHARFCLYGTWSTPPCAKAFTVSWRAASVSCGFLWVKLVYRGRCHAPSISSTHHLAQNLRQCKNVVFFGLSIWKMIQNDTKWIKWWILMDFQLKIGPYSFRRAVLTLRLHARLWSAVQDPAGGVDLRFVPGIFLINRFVWIRWIANSCIYIVEDTHVGWMDLDMYCISYVTKITHYYTIIYAIYQHFIDPPKPWNSHRKFPTTQRFCRFGCFSGPGLIDI